MTREEIMMLGMDELEERRAVIATETDEADAETLDALNAELEAIEERAKALNLEMEERKKAAEDVAKGAGKPIDMIKEETKMTRDEMRNSQAYIEAFAKYVKTGNDKECRTLFSDNVESPLTGSVPVPTFVADIVAKKLEDSKILSRVRRMEAPGNVKVGMEVSAPAAVAHEEGGAAISEEELSLQIVTLIPKTYKKFVQISDEALDSMSGEAYLRYIYDEVARGIIKAEEKAVVDAILAAAETHTSAGAIDDFVQARALLSSAAEDLVVICSPADYANYRSLQMSANYGVDPFDGCAVLFSDDATTPIIGDLSGVMMNLPKGNAIEFKYDDKTLMTSDIVKILGRQPAAIAVVGYKFFATIAAE